MELHEYKIHITQYKGNYVTTKGYVRYSIPILGTKPKHYLALLIYSKYYNAIPAFTNTYLTED